MASFRIILSLSLVVLLSSCQPENKENATSADLNLSKILGKVKEKDKCEKVLKNNNQSQKKCDEDKEKEKENENVVQIEGAAFGTNFGYRCEDEDGANVGGAVNKSGSCFGSNEAKKMASESCSTLHPMTNKPMKLVNLMNWGVCSPVEQVPAETKCSIYAEFNGLHGRSKHYFTDGEEKTQEECKAQFLKNSGGFYQGIVKTLCMEQSNNLGGGLTYYLKYEVDGQFQSPVYGDYTCM